MRYALVNSDGVVENIIAYDGQAPYTPPDGLTLQDIPEEKASAVTMGVNYQESIDKV